MTKRRVFREPVVQPLDQSIRYIPLTQGKVAIVDSADFDWLSQWNWTAMWSEDVSDFYAVRRETGKPLILMHREIAGYKLPHVDHHDHRTLNNRRNNLRPCNYSQSGANRKIQKNNKSGYKGVSWSENSQKYLAFISINGKSIYIGGYDDPADGAKAYNEKAIKYFGEFAVLNHFSG